MRYPSVYRAPLTLLRSGEPGELSPEWEKEIITEKSFQDDTGLRIAVVYKEDGTTDPIEIIVEAESGIGTLPTHPTNTASPIVPEARGGSSMKTGDMVGIIGGGMLGACTLCCVLYWLRRMMKRSRARVSIQRMPRVKIVGAVESSKGDATQREKNEEVCSICMEEFKKQCAKTVCGHYFHKECLRGWLTAHSDCPLCRETLR